MPTPLDVSTVGPPGPALTERRQLAELANCFGVAVKAWLAFMGSTAAQSAEWTALFFREVAPSSLTLGEGGARLRRIVLQGLLDWVRSHPEIPAEGEAGMARQHFYTHWGRSLAASARGCFEDEIKASPDAALVPLIDPILAGPLRAANIEAFASVLQTSRGAALARAQMYRLRFGEVVRVLVDGTVQGDFEVEAEIHELARLVESTPERLEDAAPGCRSCRSLLLPDVVGLVCPACLLRAGHFSSMEVARNAAAEADAPAEGDQFSHYELLEEIGRGGMGVIHRARDREREVLVAIKLLQPGLATSPELRERFRREAKAAASLDHPNILPVYEVGERGALPFFAMKLVDGGSLIDRVPVLAGQPREAARLVSLVARAVHHAHERGLLHRDIKPANVLLDSAGQPYVTDFGLARWIDDRGGLTRSLVVLGTAGYVAPEQAEGSGNAISPRADVYSLGVLLFELLTATRPFSGDNALTVLREAGAQPPPSARARRSDIPRELDAICLRALQPQPNARYPSAAEMAEDLDDWLAGRPARRREAPVRIRLKNWARRRPTLVGGLAGLVLLGIGWSIGKMRLPEQDRLASRRSPEATYFLKRGVTLTEADGTAEALVRAAGFMQRALDLDPDYAVAHAELSRMHSRAFWNDIDRSPTRARLAFNEAERAMSLEPSLARAWLAQGEYWFRCRREDEKAMSYLRQARKLDGKDVDALGLMVMVAKRAHRWDEAIEAARGLCLLKDRDTACLYDLGVTYEVVRRYDEADATFARAAYLAPDKRHYVANRGWVQFRRDGTTGGLANYVALLSEAERVAAGNFWTVMSLHLLERRLEELQVLVDALPPEFVVRDSTTWWPRALILAQLQQARGEDPSQALREAETRLRDRLAARKDDARAQSALALVLARKGEFEPALVAARRGAELVPVEREPVDGPDRLVDLAEVLFRAGQKAEARELVGRLLREPGYLTRHDLRLHPRWDFVRQIPEMAEILGPRP